MRDSDCFVEIDADRLWADIETNAEFGAIALDAEKPNERGRTVLTGSDADKRARTYLLERLQAAGFEVRIDAVGNIAGRWTPPQVEDDAMPIATGSHLDSVPRGGIFDGPLGVYAGVEAVRAIQESPSQPACPIEVVAFTEEEGARFGTGLLGSSVAAGKREVSSALELTDSDGETLGSALDRIGFRGDDEINPATWGSWLELHIEQGLRLVEAGAPVGVVKSIVGITNCRIVVEGVTNHAGTTAMETRTDALTAANELMLEIERLGNEAGSPTVATVGQLDISPSARNAIPGEVTFTLDMRSDNRDMIDSVIGSIREQATRVERDRGVSVTVDRYRDRPPTQLSERCVKIAQQSARECGIEAPVLHSGGLHDTAMVAACTDTAMLFAPSVDGVSHTPKEWTDPDDCVTATTVLAQALCRLPKT